MSSLSVYQVLRLFEIDAKRVDIQPTKKKTKSRRETNQIGSRKRWKTVYYYYTGCRGRQEPYRRKRHFFKSSTSLMSMSFSSRLVVSKKTAKETARENRRGFYQAGTELDQQRWERSSETRPLGSRKSQFRRVPPPPPPLPPPLPPLLFIYFFFFFFFSPSTLDDKNEEEEEENILHPPSETLWPVIGCRESGQAFDFLDFFWFSSLPLVFFLSFFPVWQQPTCLLSSSFSYCWFPMCSPEQQQ